MSAIESASDGDRCHQIIDRKWERAAPARLRTGQRWHDSAAV